MMKTFAAIGLVATAGTLSICPLCVRADKALHSPSGAYSAVAPGTMLPMQVPAASVVTLKVTGMTCGGCVLGVRKVLTRLDGVTKADVSYDKGNAVVTFDPQKASAQQMIAAIKTLGYTAVVTDYVRPHLGSDFHG